MSIRTRVVVVDDEPRMAEAIAMALGRAGHECETCFRPEDALTAVEVRGADAVVTDWRMPDMDGVELMRRLHARWPSLPVILVTAHASVPAAVAAMREGAFDYVAKPFDNDELRALVQRAIDMRRLERENRWLKQETPNRSAPEAMVAESPQTRELLALVRRVAPSRATVLIQGESGTGKELVARLVHFWSDRVGQPLVAVNCKAFAEGVLESELFGHEKGAFTGAAVTRAGCFERASGGTLFLDEIGEVSLDFQAKLLRVLQDGEVLRVGGTRSHRVDVRVVAATNRRLRDEVGAGRFRDDLYFRLNVIPIQLAPLRERHADILPLARHFLAQHAAETGRTLPLSPAAEQAVVAHPWAGNVRELENAIERGFVLAQGEAIEPGDLLLDQTLPLSPLAAAASQGSTLGQGALAGAPGAAREISEVGAGTIDDGNGSLEEWLDRAAASRIRAALAATGGQRVEAARRLGIDRTTLYRMMKRLGLE